MRTRVSLLSNSQAAPKIPAGSTGFARVYQGKSCARTAAPGYQFQGSPENRSGQIEHRLPKRDFAKKHRGSGGYDKLALQFFKALAFCFGEEEQDGKELYSGHGGEEDKWRGGAHQGDYDRKF